MSFEMIKDIYYGWWVVLACFLISLYMGGVVFFGFTAFFEPLAKEFGWSYTQISLAASLRGLEMGIFSFPIGFLVDRFGSRKLIFTGVITVGLGLLLLGFTDSLAMFYACILLVGLGSGGCTIVVTMSAVANWFDRNVGKAFGVMASGFGASGLLVPVIVWLIAVYDWRTALILMGLGMWILGIPLSFIVRDQPEPDTHLLGINLAEKSLSKPLSKEQAGEKKVFPPFREVIKNRSYMYLNAVEAIRMMIVAAVMTHIMPYLSSLGVTRTTAGLVAAAIPLCSIIGRVGFGWLGDIFEKRYVMALGFLVMSIGLLIFSNLELNWQIFPFLLLFPPSFGGTMVLRGAILREYFGKESFGKMIGLVMGSASIGGIIGPFLAGWVFDFWGSYYFIWLAFSGVSLLALFLVLRIKR